DLAPPRVPDDASFRSDLPSRVLTHQTRSRHLLVRMQVAGRDAGWFIFDSGAAMSLISPTAAANLGLQTLGSTLSGGVGTALTSAALCEARAVTLGPLQIDRMVMVQRDLSDLGRALGVEVAGAVGIDVLARAIARVRLAAGTVELFDPERFTLSDNEKEP